MKADEFTYEDMVEQFKTFHEHWTIEDTKEYANGEKKYAAETVKAAKQALKELDENVWPTSE